MQNGIKIENKKKGWRDTIGIDDDDDICDQKKQLTLLLPSDGRSRSIWGGGKRWVKNFQKKKKRKKRNSRE